MGQAGAGERPGRATLSIAAGIGILSTVRKERGGKGRARECLITVEAISFREEKNLAEKPKLQTQMKQPRAAGDTGAQGRVPRKRSGP